MKHTILPCLHRRRPILFHTCALLTVGDATKFLEGIWLKQSFACCSCQSIVQQLGAQLQLFVVDWDHFVQGWQLGVAFVAISGIGKQGLELEYAREGQLKDMGFAGFFAVLA
jgi:hypothetical protein